MPTDGRLLELMEHWDRQTSEGQSVDLTHLCADCPELRPSLEQALRLESNLLRLLDEIEDIPCPMLGPQTVLFPVSEMPTIFGYEMQTLVASGGMGEVYRARDVGLNREVALKVIRPEKLSPELLARFQTEALAVAALDHPHIVQIFEVGDYTLRG